MTKNKIEIPLRVIIGRKAIDSIRKHSTITEYQIDIDHAILTKKEDCYELIIKDTEEMLTSHL